MNRKHTLLAAVLALALGGCGISHGDRLNYGNVNAIQRNVTTEAQNRNDDSIKKGAAGIGGAILGGVLGHQIGGGSGQAIATSVGAAAGGLLGDNAVTARQESQMLEVEISLATGRVSDYNYTEQKGRTQSWGISGGVAPL